MLEPANAQELVDLDPPALVERQAELARAAGSRARRRSRRACGSGSAFRRRERRSSAGDRGKRRADVDLDPTLRELAGGVVAEPGRDLGQDLRRRVDDRPAPRASSEARVVAERVIDEIGELGERLDAGVARADEDEGECTRGLASSCSASAASSSLSTWLRRFDRVRQRLERERRGRRAQAPAARAGPRRERSRAHVSCTRAVPPLASRPSRCARRNPPPSHRRAAARHAGTSPAAARRCGAARACPDAASGRRGV